MNQLWIMVVGGDNDEERIICEGYIKDIDKAIQENEDEVLYDMDKYFELSTSKESYRFNSYDEFLELAYLIR